jgi:hypothetical protein
MIKISKLIKQKIKNLNPINHLSVESVDGYCNAFKFKKIKNLIILIFLMKIFFYILKMMIFVKDLNN